MYKVLVISASSLELKILKKNIKSLSIPGLNIDFLSLGIGPYNSLFNLTKLLESKNYDFVINIGISGIRGTTKKGIYQVSNIIDISNFKEYIVPVYFKAFPLLTCFSSPLAIKDIKFSNKNVILKTTKYELKADESLSYDIFLLDMESSAIEFVLEKKLIPRIYVKLPIDVNEDDLNSFNIQDSLEELDKKIPYYDLFSAIYKYLDSNLTNKENYSFIEEISISFSLKNKLYFLAKKYNVLTGDNLEKQFNKFFLEKQINKNSIMDFILFIESKLEKDL